MAHEMPHCMNIFRFSIMLVIVRFAIAQYVMVGASDMPPMTMNEAQALMDFKAGISKDPYGQLQSWHVMPNDSSPCKEGQAAWAGIVCDFQMRHVITVNLRSFNLTGSISPSLAFLMALSRLDLSDNLLYGELPNTLFNMVSRSPLRYLNLSHNSLEGGVSSSLANLSALVMLDLSYNKFVGKMPASLGQLQNLRVLMLEETGLTGDIADKIWQLPVLEKLWIIVDETVGLLNATLPDNFGFCGTITQLHLEGLSARGSAIPPSLGDCQKLELLAFIFVEGLQGFIPPQIWQLPRLQTLILSVYSMSLNGLLPDSFAFCHTIIHLELWGFNGTGSSIPSSLGGCHHLEVLVLSFMGLQGFIPPQIWQLPSLQELAVVADIVAIGLQFKVHGMLPSYFSFCPSLADLHIIGVNLTGEIPSSLGQCTSLRYLSLEFDNLQGSIPKSLQNLTNLTILSFIGNNLTGSIPPSMLSQCSQLQVLFLDGNKYLSGSVPRQLGELTQLRVLFLGGTSLSGPMPEELCNCTQLISLWFEQPAVVKGGIGNIPNCLGRLSQLEDFVWNYNTINGGVPMKVLKNLSQLWYLSMDYAQLRGSIPHELGNLSKLKDLSLAGNELSGIIPEPFIRALPNLMSLDLSKNKLSGEIPNELGALANLTSLDLSENKFLNGPLQKSLQNSSKLKFVRLFQNSFTGGLPSSFTKSPNLVLFDVHGNKLSGSLDSNVVMHKEQIGILPNLRVLVMSYNNLSGEIPLWLWELPMLQLLDLSNNHFSGIMPTSVSNLTYFTQDQTQNKNQSTLSMEVSQTIKFTVEVLPYILNTRVVFDVSMNHLEGEISRSFGELLGLTSLNMSHNNIRGIIPTNLGKLVNLEELDISHNNLSGTIPKELGLLGGLSTIDFSYNDLEGGISTVGFFNTRFDNKSFAHNPRLCGSPLTTNCSSGHAHSATTNFTLESNQGSQSYARQVIEWFSGFTSPWGLLVGYIVAFLAILYLRHYRV